MKKAVMIVGIWLLLSPVIEGKEIEMPVRLEIGKEDRFVYEVRVSEGGYLLDGRQKITNGIMEYELKVGERKEFRIEAVEGYEIKEIRINGESQKKQDRVTVIGVAGRSVLEVEYGKKEETPKPDKIDKEEEVKEKEKRREVSTGDILEIKEYLWLIAIAIYGMYESKKEKREGEEK